MHLFLDAWPVAITFSGGSVDQPMIDRYIEGLDAAYRRRAPCLWLSVMQLASAKDGWVTRPVGEWMRENRELIREFGRYHVFCTESQLFRFILTSLFLVSPLPAPYEIVAQLDEAVATLTRAGREHRISFDEELLRDVVARHRHLCES